MSANLFGARFLGHRQPGWHELGKVFQDAIDANTAVVEAGLDYEVSKFPIFAQTPSGPIDLNQIAIVRNPTFDDPVSRVFGTASSEYEVIQNTEIAEIINPLTTEWPVETIGALGYGETMFLSLDAGEASVKGDPVRQYFLITDTKDGATSMRIAFTPVRVVCQNTLVTGLREAIVSASLVHSGFARTSLELHVSLLAAMQKAMKGTMAKFKDLASIAITKTDAESIFLAAYPNPNRPRKAFLVDNPKSAKSLGALYDEASQAQSEWEYYIERAKAYRAGAEELFGKLNDEYPHLAMTPWHAYNAVVESADYRQGGKSTAESSLFGARAAEKSRAFAMAMTFVK